MFLTTVVEEIKTYILFSITFFFENHAVCETMWKHIVEWCSPQMWHMRISCWITKATNTHSQCVIPTAFPLQQWSQERASMLRYT
jgi:hypothetical protein